MRSLYPFAAAALLTAGAVSAPSATALAQTASALSASTSKTAEPAATTAKPVAKPAAVETATPSPEAVTELPEYPGGDAELIKFLGQNLRYPNDAWQAGIEGRVVVTFWVDETGHPYGFGILQGVSKSLDDEALRVMRQMPNWKPGRRNGQLSPMVVHIPVSFRRPAPTK